MRPLLSMTVCFGVKHFSHKLNTASMPAMAVREVIEEAFSADHANIEAAACDICATVNRILLFPCIQCLCFIERPPCTAGTANWLWKQGRVALRPICRITGICQVDIHPAARIGQGIMLDHATGIVIGETAVVENDVSTFKMLH